MSKTSKVRGLISREVQSKIDFTGLYGDCFIICCVIKNLFGEEGRSLFHETSSFYPNYCSELTDNFYSSLKNKNYLYNSDELFKIAAKYGVSESIIISISFHAFFKGVCKSCTRGIKKAATCTCNCLISICGPNWA